MAYGGSLRAEARRSTSQYSKATIALFLVLCFVGVWMMRSSSTDSDEISSTNKSAMAREPPEIDFAQIAASSGEYVGETSPEDVVNVGNNSPTEGKSDFSENQNVTDNSARSVTKQEDITEKGKTDGINDASSPETVSDENGKPEDTTTASDDTKINVGSEGNVQDKSIEQNSRRDSNIEQNYKKDSNAEVSIDEPTKNPEQKMDESKENKGNNENSQDKSVEPNPQIDSSIEQSISEQMRSVGQKADESIGDSGSQETGNDKSREQNAQTDSNTEQSREQNTDSKQAQDAENNSDGFKGDGQQSSDNSNTSDKGTQSDTNGEVQIVESGQNREENNGQTTTEVLPDLSQAELLNETTTQTGAFSTQAAESRNEKERLAAPSSQEAGSYSWKLCNVNAGADYIPCLDNEEAIKKLTSTMHYEHRERHCPEKPPTCLVPVPEGFKQPIRWPNSRDKIWYHNVPHTKLAAYKGHQNWVKVTGEVITFPGGGTQFTHGALHYIDVIQESWADIAWGKRSRVVLDVGCGVASFGGFLFDRDTLTMSLAPKDEHEAQVQFALERGIPAISAVMGTKRLPFPGMVYDVIHCARCRVPWHIEGGKLLLELNRLLRPGGYFVWSATPVYRKDKENMEIWEAMSALTKSICWQMVNKSQDEVDQVGLAIYRKPLDNSCYQKRSENNPPICQESDDPNAAWNISLQACLHKLPVDATTRGSKWPAEWPQRLQDVPYWLDNSQVGVYGKPASDDFKVDYEHWKDILKSTYLNDMGIDWSSVRNVMDMRAVYGGFAAALKDMKVWVLNVVPVNSPDTLPIIFERGLFGIYHDWCESFSSYPRTYDLLHADQLFSKLKPRCGLLPVMAEVDRLLRPEGKLIVSDNFETVNEIQTIAKSLHWEIKMTFSKQSDGLMHVQKTLWRPKEIEAASTP